MTEMMPASEPENSPETSEAGPLEQVKSEMMAMLETDPVSLKNLLVEHTGLSADEVQDVFMNDPARLAHFMAAAPDEDAVMKQVAHTALSRFRREHPDLVGFEDEIAGFVEAVLLEAEGEVSFAEALDLGVRRFRGRPLGGIDVDRVWEMNNDEWVAFRDAQVRRARERVDRG